MGKISYFCANFTCIGVPIPILSPKPKEMFFVTFFKIEYNSLPLFYQFAAVELIILGFLLWWSARDIKRYLIIIVASCFFRILMPLWPELQAIITLWPNYLAMVLIPALIYDIVSAVVTLVLLKQLGYLKKENF